MPRSPTPRSPRRRGSRAGKNPPDYSAAFVAISDLASRWAAKKRQEHGGALARRSIGERPWWSSSSISTADSASTSLLSTTQLMFLLDDGAAGSKPAQLLPLYNTPPRTLSTTPPGAISVAPAFADYVSLLSRFPEALKRSDDERYVRIMKRALARRFATGAAAIECR